MPDSKFTFEGYSTDLEKGRISFTYRLALPEQTHTFTEVLTLPQDLPVREDIPSETLENILNALLLAQGISYWKLTATPDIEVNALHLTPRQAAFWDAVYTQGLGEFYYKNNIDFRSRVRFPRHEENSEPAQTLAPARRSLLLFGGGKDSIVSAEILKKAGHDFSLYSLNDYPAHRAAAAETGKEIITMERTIDPRLIELSKGGDFYNGHVPVSIVYGLTGILAAILYGFDAVVASNEETANYGNVEYLGLEVNHQWSKSEEAEKLLRGYIHAFITPSITYYSLLRPLKEIKIAEVFSRYPQYFGLFTSCNKNFTIEGREGAPLWCGQCPKCAFVFVLLAAFIEEKKLVAIFGRNLLDDTALLDVYAQLLGLKDIKPFECVGTPEETRLAFALVRRAGKFGNTAAMRLFADSSTDEVLALEQTCLAPQGTGAGIQADLREILWHL